MKISCSKCRHLKSFGLYPDCDYWDQQKKWLLVKKAKSGGALVYGPFAMFYFFDLGKSEEFNTIRCSFFSYGYNKCKYKNYINSAAWKEKREKRLRRDGYRCQECGSRNNLTVHHKTYERFGSERMADLITLCSSCHAKYHKGGDVS